MTFLKFLCQSLEQFRITISLEWRFNLFKIVNNINVAELRTQICSFHGVAGVDFSLLFLVLMPSHQRSSERGTSVTTSRLNPNIIKNILSKQLEKLGVDSEEALRKSNLKFEKRFNYIEKELAKDNIKVSEMDLDELNTLWDDSKKLR